MSTNLEANPFKYVEGSPIHPGLVSESSSQSIAYGPVSCEDFRHAHNLGLRIARKIGACIVCAVPAFVPAVSYQHHNRTHFGTAERRGITVLHA